MHNHAPVGYKCPICLRAKGVENEDTLLKQADLVYKDKVVSAFINSFGIGKNEGHVIIVPNEHFENLYEMPFIITSIFSRDTMTMTSTKNSQRKVVSPIPQKDCNM